MQENIILLFTIKFSKFTDQVTPIDGKDFFEILLTPETTFDLNKVISLEPNNAFVSNIIVDDVTTQVLEFKKTSTSHDLMLIELSDCFGETGYTLSSSLFKKVPVETSGMKKYGREYIEVKMPTSSKMFISLKGHKSVDDYYKKKNCTQCYENVNFKNYSEYMISYESVDSKDYYRYRVKQQGIIYLKLIELIQWSYYNTTSIKLEFAPLVKSKYPFDTEEEVNYHINYELYYSYNPDDVNYMYSTCYLSKMVYKSIIPYVENGKVVYYFHGVDPNHAYER